MAGEQKIVNGYYSIDDAAGNKAGTKAVTPIQAPGYTPTSQASSTVGTTDKTYASPTGVPAPITLADRYPSTAPTTDASGIGQVFQMDQPDEAAIRKQKEDLAQAQVNAVNDKYAVIERNDARNIDQMNREQRAANSLRGLTGARKGAADTIATSNKGTDIQNLTAAQKASEIGAIMANADDRASTEFQRQKDEYLANAKDKFAAEQGLADRIRTEAMDNIKSLGAHYSYDDLSKQKPELVQQLMKETGLDEFGLKAQFLNNAKDSSTLVSDKPEIIGNKAVFFVKNADGSISQQSLDLPADSTKKIKDVRLTDGGAQILYEDGTYETRGTPGNGDGNTPSNKPSWEEFLNEAQKQAGMTLNPDSAQYSALKDQYNQLSNISLGKLTPTEKNTLTRAGLTGADTSLQAYFLGTPSTFQDEYARKLSTGEAKANNVQDLAKQFTDWQAAQANGSSAKVNSFIEALKKA